MKNLFLIVASIFIFATSKAQDTKTTGPQPTKEPTVYKGVTDQACAIEISFGSYGSGIDGPTYEKITALIEKHKLKSTSKNIGREGETRICLALTEIKGRKKCKFINQLKKLAKEGQLTSLSIR